MERYIALLRVIEVGSFTKAAELLGYTQPALSQMIASFIGAGIIHQDLVPLPLRLPLRHSFDAGGRTAVPVHSECCTAI